MIQKTKKTKSFTATILLHNNHHKLKLEVLSYKKVEAVIKFCFYPFYDDLVLYSSIDDYHREVYAYYPWWKYGTHYKTIYFHKDNLTDYILELIGESHVAVQIIFHNDEISKIIIYKNDRKYTYAKV